jgi:hypothetical protein
MIAHRPAYGATVMRFSWTGLILAPLPVPLIFSVIGAPMMGPPQEGASRYWYF